MNLKIVARFNVSTDTRGIFLLRGLEITISRFPMCTKPFNFLDKRNTTMV